MSYEQQRQKDGFAYEEQIIKHFTGALVNPPHNIETHFWCDVQYIFHSGKVSCHNSHVNGSQDCVCFWVAVGLHCTLQQHLDKWMVAGEGHGASSQDASHSLVHKVSDLESDQPVS